MKSNNKIITLLYLTIFITIISYAYIIYVLPIDNHNKTPKFNPFDWHIT